MPFVDELNAVAEFDGAETPQSKNYWAKICSFNSGTQSAYNKNIAGYINYCGSEKLNYALSSSAYSYCLHLRNVENQQSSTIKSKMSPIMIFFSQLLSIKLPDVESGIWTLIAQWKKGDNVAQTPGFSQENMVNVLTNEGFQEDVKWKLVVVMALVSYSGLLRVGEAHGLRFENCFVKMNHETGGEYIDFGFYREKSGNSKKMEYFHVTNPQHVAIIKDYILCFEESERTGQFLRYLKKRNFQVVGTLRLLGENSMQQFVKDIATHLNLPNPDNYSFHTFRRSGAQHLADSGASNSTIQCAGGWATAGSSVINSYVKESAHTKRDIASRLGNASSLSSSSNESVGAPTFNPLPRQPIMNSFNPYAQQPIMNFNPLPQPPIMNFNPYAQPPIMNFNPYAQQPMMNSFNPYAQQPMMNSFNPYAQQPMMNSFNPYAQQPMMNFNPYAQQPMMNSFNPYAQQPTALAMLQGMIHPPRDGSSDNPSN